MKYVIFCNMTFTANTYTTTTTVLQYDKMIGSDST